MPIIKIAIKIIKKKPDGTKYEKQKLVKAKKKVVSKKSIKTTREEKIQKRADLKLERDINKSRTKNFTYAINPLEKEKEQKQILENRKRRLLKYGHE